MPADDGRCAVRQRRPRRARRAEVAVSDHGRRLARRRARQLSRRRRVAREVARQARRNHRGRLGVQRRRAARRRAAARRPVHDQGLLQGPRALERHALLPLQQPAWRIEQQRGASRGSAHAIGDDPPRTAAWGYCDRDYPRAAIVSPYAFKTAQAHYEALLAETKTRGGPTQHTYATVPGEWTGRYARVNAQTAFGTWYGDAA